MEQAVKLLIEQLKERSAKLYWTYVIQYNQAEQNHKYQKILTIISLVLSALVASAAFFNVLETCGISQKVVNMIIFGLGIISTVILSFMSKYNYEKRISANIEYGSRLRRIWMQYQSLITDIKAGKYETYDDMCIERDKLRDEEYEALRDAPLTLQKAVQKASKKIKGGHGDIKNDEIKAGNETQNL